MPAPPELASLAGTPETALGEADLARLPTEAPPAPWDVSASALVWMGRLRPGVAHLPPAVARRGRRAVAAVGAFVSYDRTPVGPYHEVLAGVALVGRSGIATHVPFMAVDSDASVVGSRANWALPKVLASFEGGLDAVSAQGDGWSVAARAHPRGPAVSLWARLGLVQKGASGELRGAVGHTTGRGRLARVDVEVEGSDALRACLPSGSCFGVVVERARGRLGVAGSAHRRPR